MFTEAELGITRRTYARQLTAAVGAQNTPLEAAFARVRREDFLGPGPWPVFRGMGRYALTQDADPVHLYADILIGIVPERGLNNGQPSLHAHLLAAAKPAKGDHVVHIGTGAGYYTAIMAECVGPQGRVTGIEFDAGLAARAAANLKAYLNVRVIAGDGATAPFEKADVIYVNAGATRPADIWLDRLADGGRLILPLTTAQGFGMPDENVATRGAVFLIERRAGDFHAKWISPVAIFPCAGARDDASEHSLAAAFKTGRWAEVTRLYRHNDLAAERCFLKAPGWSLAYF